MPTQIMTYCDTNSHTGLFGGLANTDAPTLAYMAAHNSAYCCHPFVTANLLTDTNIAEQVIADFHVLRDAGVKVWLEIESFLSDAGVATYGLTPSTTVDQYETLFGDCMAMYDAEGSYLLGYGTEAAYDNGVIWMANHAHNAGKLASQRCYYGGGRGGPSHPLPPIAQAYGSIMNTTMGYPARRALVDQWIWECYTICEITGAAAIEQWTMQNHPELYGNGYTRGITTAVSEGAGNATQWWSDILFPVDGFGAPDTVVLPLSSMQRLARAYLEFILKPAIGKIDVVEFMPMDVNWLGGGCLIGPGIYSTAAYDTVGSNPTLPLSIIGQIKFWESMCLDTDFAPVMEETTATLETNQGVTIPIGWNA
jgi:hypothetical protein